jgi:serine phosphatase RsbU (regulator of sigma subunit)
MRGDLLSKYWGKTINIGIDDSTSIFDRKRIRLLNGICTICIIAYTGNMFPLYGHWFSFIECIVAVMVCGGIMWINSTKRFELACHTYNVWDIVMYTFMGITSGANDKTELFLIPSSVVAMLFFKDMRIIVTYFVINLLCYGLVKYCHTILGPINVFPGSERLAISNSVLLFVILFLIIVHFKSENAKQEGLLEDRNFKLEEEKDQVDKLLKDKEKSNIVLEEKNKIIEEKNKDIIDSINYAKRLQEAILPPLSVIKKHLPESFVLYKPKDIVAGDFYWMEPFGDNVLIAACDCTGHGVPGAMVSVVCSNALNRALNEFKIRDTGKLLDKTRELVIETFGKSESEVQDGMDISFCAINAKENRLEWSGANNPLWYISNGEMKEITADKQPIGRQDGQKPFTTHVLTLQKGDVLYLFTDGYADQFGGPKGKKFKYKKLQEILLAISSLSMDKQKEMLDETIETWRGNLEQIDDVLIMGIRV